MDSCENCRFWKRGWRDASGWRTTHGNGISAKSGYCQAHAPRGDEQPVTYHDVWCGEHQPLSAKAAEGANGELLAALLDIRGAHMPDQPATSGADEITWAYQHIGRIRKIAADAIDKLREKSS